ncbi:unnamed protein product [Blepharisma stoltei]|uniref:F-box domain-containing protein n=1 Tax=Blepharisma stoltei TaxID=1481888 RepID=A0AAU9KIL6_9CILI|nr:unnamed protein product [Blepharisma stoltei]
MSYKMIMVSEINNSIMNKLPAPVLSYILTIVGPWSQIANLLLVCKKWSQILQNAQHYISFEGSRNPKFYSGSIDIRAPLSRFLDGWRMLSLNLRNVYIIEEQFLANLIISQPWLKKLDLTNNKIDLGILWTSIDKIVTEKNPRKPGVAKFEHNLEELRITNNESKAMKFNFLVKNFPNIKKLYAGNTNVTVGEFKLIIKSLWKLELLDLSNCKGLKSLSEIANDKHFKHTKTRLKTLFLPDYDNQSAIELLIAFGVQVITRNIGDVLFEMKSSSDINSLTEWISLGGDINLMRYQEEDEEVEVWTYPQLEIIGSNLEENLLIQIFRILIWNGLDLSFHSNVSEKTLVNAAINFGYKNLVLLFMKNNVDICPVPFPNNTALKKDLDGREYWTWIKISDPGELPSITNAAIKEDISILNLFIEANLQNTDFFDSKYCNPVCTAIKSGNNELLMYFISNSFSYFKCSHFKNFLISNSEMIDVFLSYEYLKKTKFPFDILYEAARYYTYKGPEDLAIRILEIAIEIEPNFNETLMLYSQSRVSAIDVYYKPLMLLASEFQKEAILLWLLNHKFDIDIKDHNGSTAFMNAAENGNLEMIKNLKGKGANINIVNKKLETALHLAAKSGKKEIIEELLQMGVNMDNKTIENYTALDYAEKNYKDEIYQILKKHGMGSGKTETRNCNIF